MSVLEDLCFSELRCTLLGIEQRLSWVWATLRICFAVQETTKVATMFGPAVCVVYILLLLGYYVLVYAKKLTNFRLIA